MTDRRVLAVLFATATYAIAAGREAFFGHWKQLSEKSGGTIQPPVSSATVEIKPAGGNRVSVTMTVLTEGGKTNKDEYIVTLDGSPVKDASGADSGRWFRQLGPTVWQRVFEKQ